VGAGLEALRLLADGGPAEVLGLLVQRGLVALEHGRRLVGGRGAVAGGRAGGGGGRLVGRAVGGAGGRAGAAGRGLARLELAGADCGGRDEKGG